MATIPLFFFWEFRLRYFSVSDDIIAGISNPLIITSDFEKYILGSSLLVIRYNFIESPEFCVV